MANVTENDLVGYFHRHVVPMHFTFDNGQSSHSALITAFVMSVNDEWLLVTAGHCLRDIETLVRQQGYKISTCNLIDSNGLGATHSDPIPFAYEWAHPAYICDDEGYDYGIVPLSRLYRGLLHRNNVRPLTENVWKKQPNVVDFYMLLGVPLDFVTYTPDSVAMGSALFPVEAIGERPEGFTPSSIPLFYGRIKLAPGMSRMQGLSGGPIFAFRENPKGELRYWLTALQSRGLPDSHYIAACPTHFLGKALENILGASDGNPD
jgi:hypothetical protein